MVVKNTLFETLSLVAPLGCFNAVFEESKDIVGRAIIEHQPYAVCLMLSGGDDSLTALQVAMMLGVKIDFIIHGNTGTGLPEVLPYVANVAARAGIKLLIADAGDAYINYVTRKGFFGVGVTAHSYAYHILKVNPFDTVISKYIRKGIKGRKIILLNGVRVDESDNRADNFGDNPYRWQGNNLWVNIIHWWTKRECLAMLDGEGVKRNPVSVALGRSGECNCGTMQNELDRIAASEFNPQWGKWMQALRKEIYKKHGWDIWHNPSKEIIAERKKEAAMMPDYLPMCVGCKARAPKLFQD